MIITRSNAHVMQNQSIDDDDDNLKSQGRGEYSLLKLSSNVMLISTNTLRYVDDDDDLKHKSQGGRIRVKDSIPGNESKVDYYYQCSYETLIMMWMNLKTVKYSLPHD